MASQQAISLLQKPGPVRTAVLATSALGGGCLLLHLVPLQFFLITFLLAALAMFATKPSPDALPTQEAGIISSFTSMFTGGEAPVCSDLGVLLLATHRERVFLGALGRWLEVPKSWRHLLDLKSTPLSQDPSAAASLRLAKSEAEARSLRQRGDLAGAAEVYMRLEAAAQGDPEAGACRQRYAEEAGRCLVQAGQAQRAVEPLQRALSQTRDLRARRSAAEALADAALNLPERTQLTQAAEELFGLAEADWGTAEGDLAARAAFSSLRRGYEIHGAAGRFDDAASLLALAMDRGAAFAGDVAPGENSPWLHEVEGCIWRCFLALLRRDDGDSVSAGLELNRRVREFPAAAASRCVAAALDVLQACEDGCVEALEDASFALDRHAGQLAPWQLQGMLTAKQRLVAEDLS